MYFIFGGGGDDDIFQRGSFFGGGGSGIPRNGSGGVNFSRFNDKTEFHGVYFFNHNQTLATSAGTRQTFLPEGSFQNATTDRNDRSQNAHQLNLRLEHKIDSFQTLSLQVNSAAASRTALQGSTSRVRHTTSKLQQRFRQLLLAAGRSRRGCSNRCRRRRRSSNSRGQGFQHTAVGRVGARSSSPSGTCPHRSVLSSLCRCRPPPCFPTHR